MGTKSSPGPKLYGMSGHLNKPGVYENELGITLQQSIEMAGGMKGGKYKAAICGGISMGVLGPDQLDVKLDFDDVRFRGGCLGLGTAGMIVLNEHTDMVAALRNCVRFYAHESCGQCTPCREGSGWMIKILNRIMDGMGRARDIDLLMELEKTMGIMPGTTICGLADGTSWATPHFHQQVLLRVRRHVPRRADGAIDGKPGEEERKHADGVQYTGCCCEPIKQSRRRSVQTQFPIIPHFGG